jgi:hypothetical protein
MRRPSSVHRPLPRAVGSWLVSWKLFIVIGARGKAELGRAAGGGAGGPLDARTGLTPARRSWHASFQSLTARLQVLLPPLAALGRVFGGLLCETRKVRRGVRVALGCRTVQPAERAFQQRSCDASLAALSQRARRWFKCQSHSCSPV